MGRSRGGSSAAPARRPAPAAPAPAPVQHQQHAPAMQQPQSGGLGSGLMGSIVQGMAFGGGSEIGHQAVRSMMGGSSSSHDAAPQQATQATQAPSSFQQQSSANVCLIPQQELYKCLQERNGDANACQFYFDSLKQCNENNKQF